MGKVRLGIIGVGNMGSSHIKNYIKGDMPEIIITAVADIKPDRLEWAKEQLPDVKLFNTASALMDSGEVDAVLFATPHYDHPPLVIEALKTAHREDLIGNSDKCLIRPEKQIKPIGRNKNGWTKKNF